MPVESVERKKGEISEFSTIGENSVENLRGEVKFGITIIFDAGRAGAQRSGLELPFRIFRNR